MGKDCNGNRHWVSDVRLDCIYRFIFLQSCFETGKPENVRLRHSNDSDASGVCSYDNKKSFAGRDPFGNRKGKAFLGGGTVFYTSVCFYLLDYALCVFYGWK